MGMGGRVRGGDGVRSRRREGSVARDGGGMIGKRG